MSESEPRPTSHHRHPSFPRSHLTSSPTYRPAPPPPPDVSPQNPIHPNQRRPALPTPPPPPRLFRPSMSVTPSNVYTGSPQSTPPHIMPFPTPSPRRHLPPVPPQNFQEYSAQGSPGPSTRPLSGRLFSAPNANASGSTPIRNGAVNPFLTPEEARTKTKSLRPWSLAGNGRHDSRWSDKSSGSDRDRIRDGSPSPADSLDEGSQEDLTIKLGQGFHPLNPNRSHSFGTKGTFGSGRTSSSKGKGSSINTIRNSVHDWPDMDGSSDTDEDTQPDAYSWVDPSVVGTARLRDTPDRSARSEPSSPTGLSARTIISATQALQIPDTPESKAQSKPKLDPAESYNLLLAYQTSSSGHGQPKTPIVSPPTSPTSSTDHITLSNSDPEWHELVDVTVLDSLGRHEVKRQGLWWELVKGEVEYVKDLRTISDSFIAPLRTHDPALIQPESRLSFFIEEVFSTAPALREAHEKLLLKLLERQRYEWPLVTSATDLLLHHFLEHVSLYETYMKNYPFAEARVRREGQRNPAFRRFIDTRNTLELTRKRDLSVFLSRPISRLPRLMLLLEALLRASPEEHPDREEIPTVTAILTNAVKGSQPGIETAEAKIKLWNVAERLMFRKGEMVELDIADPKRTLVHSGFVFRRVRDQTNWHGWQDLHAFMLDNYFILTRDEEGGKHVVVSRPIHLDFLKLVSVDGTPERRYDYLAHVRRHARTSSHGHDSHRERLMYPFTIVSKTGNEPHEYTLCVASQNAREQWKEKILSAQTLRNFDMESNRIFAVHNIYKPPEIREPIVAADTFTWLGRETVAVSTPKSVWLGWRRDSKSYRELIMFSTGLISSISIVPDFGWLLVLISGSLLAFSLNELVPTHEPSTWKQKSRGGGHDLSGVDQPTAFARVGMTKGRTMVVHAAYTRTSHQTLLTFEEPLLASNSDRQYSTKPFRRFASLSIPGYAIELSFFKQTVAVVTEKGFIIAEAGNPTFNAIPTIPVSVNLSSSLQRMISASKPLGMYQIGENEFVLAYEWGACFVTKFGEVSRNGSFMRWNVVPSYVAYRPPYLLLFDERTGKAEVRDVTNARMCEVLTEKGMKALRLSRAEQGMLAISPKGLLEIVETVELQ